MIIAHRDLNAFERSLEQGCALHGRVIRRKAVVRVRAGNAARGRTGARLPDRGQ